MHNSIRNSHRLPLHVLLDVLLAYRPLVLLLRRAPRGARQAITELVLLLLLLVHVVDVFGRVHRVDLRVAYQLI